MHCVMTNSRGLNLLLPCLKNYPFRSARVRALSLAVAYLQCFAPRAKGQCVAYAFAFGWWQR